MKKLLSILLSFSVLLSFTLLHGDEEALHKIIYFVSPPRSLSVAFTRMMQARGDFEIFHEPSVYAYDLIHYPEFAAATFKDDSFKTFDEVKQALYASAKKRDVFAKEMSFAAADFVINDPEFLLNEQVHFVFLVRNPHHSAISFYKRSNDVPHNIAGLIGFEQLYRLFETVNARAKHPALVLFSEDLYTHPEETVAQFCQKVGIPMMPSALLWKSLDDSFDGYVEWHEQKKSADLVHHWHGSAIVSTGFTKPATYDVDENGVPTFSEIRDPDHKEQYRNAWLYNKPYYEKFLETHLTGAEISLSD